MSFEIPAVLRTYGVIAKCEVAPEHYNTMLLIPTMQFFHQTVKGLNELDTATVQQALRAGLNVYLFPITEETPEQWEPAFPEMCVSVWEFVGPHETVEVATRLAKSWMHFIDQNCKLNTGTRLMIRGVTKEHTSIPEIEWRTTTLS